MPIPVFTPGEVLTSDLVNQWFVPNAAQKASDQSVTSSTTLVNDSALSVGITATASYIFNCFLDYEGGVQGSSDLKWQFTAPVGSSMHYTVVSRTTAGVLSVLPTLVLGGPGTAGTNGAGNTFGLMMWGTLVIGSTAGTFGLQWAQNTSSATATIVHTGSYLQLQRTN